MFHRGGPFRPEEWLEEEEWRAAPVSELGSPLLHPSGQSLTPRQCECDMAVSCFSSHPLLLCPDVRCRATESQAQVVGAIANQALYKLGNLASSTSAKAT